MAGNDALPLIAADGDPADDAARGRMAADARAWPGCPYTRQIFAALGAVIGRSRFMRIEQEGEVTPHVDLAHYWWDHVRVHVPVLTDPSVELPDRRRHRAHGRRRGVGDRHLEAALRAQPGVAPAHPPRHRHRGLGPVLAARRPQPRGRGRRQRRRAQGRPEPPRRRPHLPHRGGQPAEGDEPVGGRAHPRRPLDDLRSSRPAGADEVAAARRRPAPATGGRCGPMPATRRPAWPPTKRPAPRPASGCSGSRVATRSRTRIDVVSAVRSLVLVPAIDPELARVAASSSRRPSPASPGGSSSPSSWCPRPGPAASLLFETLARAPELLHRRRREPPAHRVDPGPRAPPSEAGRRTASPPRTPRPRPSPGAPPLRRQRPRPQRRPAAAGPAVPPAGEDPEERAPRAVPGRGRSPTPPSSTSTAIHARPSAACSTPGDRGASSPTRTCPTGASRSGRCCSRRAGESSAASRSPRSSPGSGSTTTEQLLDDLEALAPDRWCVASYDQLVADPSAEIARLCEHLGLAWDVDLGERLPDSRHTLDSPHPDKWQRNAEELEPVWDLVRPVAMRAHERVRRPAAHPTGRPGGARRPQPGRRVGGDGAGAGRERRASRCAASTPRAWPACSTSSAAPCSCRPTRAAG